MKFLLPPDLLASLLLFVSFIPAKEVSPSTAPVSPLAAYSPVWNDAKYLKCNTAARASYLAEEEKKTIYILNMARMNPVLFANTVVKQYPGKTEWHINSNSTYYKSLLETLLKLKPMDLLYPDSLCYKSALCHALTTGKNGTVTHDRTTDDCRKQQYFSGECCHYGNNTAIDILLSLLIDEGVASLGHREICLSSYSKLGVSIQPHTAYNYTAVLDFKY
jgi:uncharacterized protein YkwD